MNISSVKWGPFCLGGDGLNMVTVCKRDSSSIATTRAECYNEDKYNFLIVVTHDYFTKVSKYLLLTNTLLIS